MTTAWHVYDGAKKDGPISAEEVERRYAAGELGEGALAWREGWAEWRPIAAALAWLRGAREAEARSQAAPAPKGKAPIVSALLSLLIAVLAAVAVKRQFDALGDVYMTADPAAVVQGYQVLVWGLAAALAAVIVPLLWLCGRLQRWRPKSMAPRLLGALLVLAALLGAIFIALQVRLTGLVREIAETEAAQVAEVRYQPDGRWVDIEGEIGPRLAIQVDQTLRAHPDAAGIRIDSPGGMTTEALRLARTIEAKGLDVRVEQECVSACIAILVSGRRRTAEWNAKIALHALAPAIGDYPAFLKLATDRGRGEFEGYVARHRMPKAWIDQAEAVGPTHVRPTPPPDLLTAGVLTAVTRGGVPLGLTDAKWLWVEAQTGENHAFAEVLEAIRTAAPDVVRASGDELYSAVGSGDSGRIDGSVRAIVAPLVRRAETSAAAGPAYLYLETNLDQVAYFSQRGDWSGCAAYLDGRLASGGGTPDLLRKEQTALAAMILSAGEANWRPAETGPDGLEAGREATSGATERLAVQGLGPGSPASDRLKCLRAFFALQAIDTLGPERGAAAWRALLRAHG